MPGVMHKALNILIVYCHPEATSFNAALRDAAAIETFESIGHVVEVSDLYGEGFDPVEKSGHYQNRVLTTRFEPLTEQRHACETDSVLATASTIY
jgi:NAD(P)H dehydrogenase (quinone)